MSDEVLAEVIELLFGGGATNELVAKMSPTQSDVSTKGGMSDRKKRQLTAGLSAVGAGAGAAGLALGGHNLTRAYKTARYGMKGNQAARKAAGVVRPITTKRKAAKAALSNEKLATGLIPLEVAGLSGEIAATKILHGDTKKKVHKGLGDTEILNNAKDVPTKRSLTLAAITDPRTQKKGVEYARKGAGVLKKVPNKQITHNKVEKRDEVDVLWDGEIAKADADKQQIFGWASVVEVGGEPVLDLQGDLISPDEMEKAAYEYVVKSRKGGDMHKRDNWDPIQKSDMIESFIVTDEKRQAMGLPEDIPTGWWVGFQVRDPDLWEDVKTGKRTGFSIHGRGKRTPV